jgi:FAD/FMN-containing dehydrogenase
MSIGGGRFSQGGQTAHPDTLHLDLRRLNRILKLDAKARTITVQAGATWRQIQEHIDPLGLSIRIMQTYANFTVGGSLSVNVHGRYIGEGPIIRSVESFRIVLADGSLHHASPSENPDLFYAAIGGYGGIGVITDATLNLTENVAVERVSISMQVADYPEHFNATVRDNPDAVFSNGDIYPPELKTVRSVTWYKSRRLPTLNQHLRPTGQSEYISPHIIRTLAASDAAKKFRRLALEPLLHLSKPVVWRNNEASYDLSELPAFTHHDHTFGLREYFVPVRHFTPFVDRMRDIFKKHNVNVINISIRHALPDSGSHLAWAREEVFAFVVYYRQGITSEEQEEVRIWTREMIDAATDIEGSYYLPYQVYESPNQFHRAYPHADSFIATKRRFDPNNRFRNILIDSIINPNQRPDINAIPNYRQNPGTPLIRAAESWINLRQNNSANRESRTHTVRQIWEVCERGTAAAQHVGFPGSDALGHLRQAAWIASLRTLILPMSEKLIPKAETSAKQAHLLVKKAKNSSTPETASMVAETAHYQILSTPHSALPHTLFKLMENQVTLEEFDGKTFVTLCLATPNSHAQTLLPSGAIPLSHPLTDPLTGETLHHLHVPVKLLPTLLEKPNRIHSIFR